MALYEQIVRDIEDPSTRKEIISSLALFGEKITKDNVEELREKVNQKFKSKKVPQRLTHEQIDEILDYAIPKAPAVIDMISQDNNRQIKEFMRSELRDRKMFITQENIETLKNEIRETYYRSLVSPGDSVGVEVAMSFGQPLTQMNLDTFHQSGTMSDLGSGVKSLQELFNVSVNRKKNLTTIHFKDKDLTREEIHIQGKTLKGVSIKSLLETSEIMYVDGRVLLDNIEEENSEWWYDNYFQMYSIETELKEAVFKMEIITTEQISVLEKYHTADIAESAYVTLSGNLVVVYDPLIFTPRAIFKDLIGAEFLYSRPRFEYDRFLRLKLNVIKCYNLGVTMNDIVSALQDETIMCVASPLSVGIIDIHPNKEYVQETVDKFVTKGTIKFSSCEKKTNKFTTPVNLDEENVTQLKVLFLTVIIEECLSDIYIKGIKGIKNIIPVSENIINIMKTNRVTDIDVLLRHQKPVLWYITINYMKLKYTGIPHEKILNLCGNAGVTVIENNIFDVNGGFSRNPHLIVDSVRDPKDLISALFNEADRYVKEQVKEMTTSSKETEFDLPDYPDVYRNAFYNYAYAEGEKIVRKLMRHRKLDNKMILPNNPNEIYDIFGIESARLYMVREYVNLIESSDSYVTPCNIELLVDYQTGMGFLTAIHAIGSSKQGTSSLSAATFNDPVGTFQKAATIGKTDKINSISSCIMTGKQSLNGSGLSEVSFDPIKMPMIDELPRKFTDHEDFCEQRYVIRDEKESNSVDINIEHLMDSEKKKVEPKFSIENTPTVVVPMDAPDFLNSDTESDPVDVIEPIEPLDVPIPQPISSDDDSDFEIPDALNELPDLEDF